MVSKLATMVVGLIYSVVFGTAGGMLAAGLICGAIGFIWGLMNLDPFRAFGGFLFFGMLGGIQGAILGMATGAIGWLPSVLFRESPRVSYVAAALLSTVVGIFACYYYATSSYSSVGGWSTLTAIVLAGSICISGGVSSNFILRRWLVDVSRYGEA